MNVIFPSWRLCSHGKKIEIVKSLDDNQVDFLVIKFDLVSLQT